MSITQGNVPDEIKRARVFPLHKKGNRTDPSTFRHLSILSIISKVMAKVICAQVETYLSSNKLFHEFQSGFRHSTNTCFIHMSDYIKSQSDQGKYADMVLLDIQKAFNKVDHCTYYFLNFKPWVLTTIQETGSDPT